jgi:hypothetical protein
MRRRELLIVPAVLALSLREGHAATNDYIIKMVKSGGTVVSYATNIPTITLPEECGTATDYEQTVVSRDEGSSSSRVESASASGT